MNSSGNFQSLSFDNYAKEHSNFSSELELISPLQCSPIQNKLLHGSLLNDDSVENSVSDSLNASDPNLEVTNDSSLNCTNTSLVQHSDYKNDSHPNQLKKEMTFF